MFKHLIIFISLLSSVYSQVILTESGKGSRSLVISKMKFDVKAIGFLAETHLTMTFVNPNSEDMIGNFYLPIPENSRVTAYALDIKGKLVDAVAIEKVRARQVFEAITRRRIDPGLLEWSKGNNFKTRVYPIPGKGTRTVRVKILTELKKTDKGFIYEFPLKFDRPTNIMNLKLWAAYDEKPLIQTSVFKDLTLNKGEKGEYTGNFKQYKVNPDSIKILFPDDKSEWQFIHEAKDKKLYYIWGKHFKHGNKARKAAKNLIMFWDASHSRNFSNKAKELEVLKGIIKPFKDGFKIDLIVFRESFEKVKTFEIKAGKCDALISYLSPQVYDGGTLLDPKQIKDKCSTASEAILFTDALSTLSNNKEVRGLNKYLTIFNSSKNLDKLVIDKILSKTQGRFINLNDRTVSEAVNEFSANVASYEAGYNNYQEHFPRSNENIDQIFSRTGVLDDDENEESFELEFKNASIKRYQYVVSRDDMEVGEIVKSFFAVKKLKELLVDGQETNIKRHGLEYHMVTPYTSLLVLETYSDYERYGVEPPESLPEWRQRYLENNEGGREEDFKPSLKWITKQNINAWDHFLEWYKTDFEYPLDFVWQKSIFFLGDSLSVGMLEIVQTKTAEGLSSGGLDGLDGGDDLVGGIGDIAGGGGEPFAAIREVDPFDEDDPFAEEAEDGEIEKVFVEKKEWKEEAEEFKKLSSSKDPYKTYLKLKSKFGGNPDFYLKAARILFSKELEKEAFRAASTSAEIMSGNVSFLRKQAFVFVELKKYDLATKIYKLILDERPDEPQSWRDLGMSLAEQGKYAESVDVFNKSLSKGFPRFDMRDILILDLNRILALAKIEGVDLYKAVNTIYVKEVQMDLRVVVTWNADNYDINLGVTEPSGEAIDYAGYPSTIGGKVTHEFSSYGPEQYVLKKAMHGFYNLSVSKVSNRTQEVVGDIICRVDIYTDFGRKNEQHSVDFLKISGENPHQEIKVELGIKGNEKNKRKRPDHLVLSPFDSAISVAAKMKGYGYRWKEVKAANPKVDWTKLRSGLKIKLPPKN